jgi:hypothetical protein
MGNIIAGKGFDYPFGVFKLFFKRDRQHNDQVKKGTRRRKWSTKQYTENKDLSNKSFVFLLLIHEALHRKLKILRLLVRPLLSSTLLYIFVK